MSFDRRVLSTTVLLVASVWACRPSPPPSTPAAATSTQPHAQPPADAGFQALAQRLLAAHWERNPAAAVEVGRHEHDGRLRDVSPEGLNEELAALAEARRELEAIDPATLGPRARVEHGTLLVAVRGAAFELGTRRSPW